MKQSTPSSVSSPRFPPLLVLLFGILAVSTASVFTRFAQEDASSLVIAASRLTIAALVLAPITLARRRHELVTLERKQALFLILSGLFLALHFLTWITSLEYTTVASSVVLVTTAPLWVALLSPVFLKERIGAAIFAGLLIALLGGSLVGLSRSCQAAGGQILCPPLADFVQGASFSGNLLALAGAWFAAGYLIIGRRMRGTLSLETYVFMVYGVASLLLLAMVWLRGERLAGYSWATYGWLIALGLVPQLFGHSTFNWALRYLSAAYVSVALLGEPIGASLLALLLLGEAPVALELVGGALILAGIYTASRSRPAAGSNEDQIENAQP